MEALELQCLHFIKFAIRERLWMPSSPQGRARWGYQLHTSNGALTYCAVKVPFVPSPSVGMAVSWSAAWEPQETTNDYAQAKSATGACRRVGHGYFKPRRR